LAADARQVTARLDPDSRAYWIQRAGGQQKVDQYNTMDRGQSYSCKSFVRDLFADFRCSTLPLVADDCISAFHALLAAFKTELDARGWHFFQSKTRPGIKVAHSPTPN